MKTCSKCKQDLELGSFNKDNSNKDGLQRRCRNCRKAHYQTVRKRRCATTTAWKKANPDRVKASSARGRAKPGRKAKQQEYSKKWREANPEYGKKWREENPEKINGYYRAAKAKT